MSEQAKEGNVVEFAPLEFPPVEYGVTEAALAELAERFKEPDASTDDGYEHCKNGCRELSALRSGIETRRLDLKRPVTEWVRTHIDNRGKDLIRRIRKIEAPVRVEKERVNEILQAEARKVAKIEQDRINAIDDNIEKIAATAREQNPNDTAADYQQYMTWLTELAITDEVFGERVDDAKTERDAALFKLGQWHERAVQREADDIRRKAEQAELDLKKKELDEIEAKQKQESERIEKEKREAEERKAAAEKVEQEKVDREERDKAEAEKKRITNIRRAIDLIKTVAAMPEDMSAENLDGVISKLKDKQPNEAMFREFLPDAMRAWQESVDTLTGMAKDALEREERETEEKETNRVETIKGALYFIRTIPDRAQGSSSEELDRLVAAEKLAEPTEADFAEFLPEAILAWKTSIAALEVMATEARSSEEQARRDAEARLPDRDKLLRWCDALAEIPEPEVLNEKAQKTLRRYTDDLSKLLDRLRSDIGKL